MIKLIEYGQETLVSRGSYNEEDRLLLSRLQYEDIDSGECRFFLRETSEGLYIKPMNYVGTIQLSMERINIYPRFNHSFSRLISMILFTQSIKYKSFRQNIEVNEEDNDIYEIIINLFIEEVLNLLKNNLFREYVGFNENLKVVRGRIDFNNHLRKNFLRGDNIFCCYDELNSDIIENQIILKALKFALRLTTKSETKKIISNYIDIFRSVCNEYKGNKVPEIHYNRLNYHYKETHYFSKVLIENIGTDNMYQFGDRVGRYSLLINMNLLFEQFVSSIFMKYLSPHYDVKSQWKIGNAITNFKGNTYRLIIPDIILKDKDNGQIIIIDTKNKDYGNKYVHNEDIYQLSYYGLYFYDMFKSLANINILYPKYENQSGRNEQIFINTTGKIVNRPSINVKSFDIDAFLELISQGAGSTEKIRERLLEYTS